jgi:hypothetical protein
MKLSRLDLAKPSHLSIFPLIDYFKKDTLSLNHLVHDPCRKSQNTFQQYIKKIKNNRSSIIKNKQINN